MPTDRAPEGGQAEVLVATTWACNLRCAYCFVAQQGLAASGARMSPAMAARVVDALDEGLSAYDTLTLHLYGGEPLTNLPALEALLARAQTKRPGRFRFALTTNGVTAPPGAAPPRGVLELLEAGCFQVVLSLDGPAAIHDACRRTASGAPTHATVLRFLEALRSETHCWVRGSAVVRAGWSLAQAEAYLRSLPVDVIKAQAVRLAPGSPHALSTAERHTYYADLEALGWTVIAELEAGCPPRDDRFSSRVLQLLCGVTRTSFCGAGASTFGVTPDGTILPCVLLDPATARLGHVQDDPATWIRAGQAWQAARLPRRECSECTAWPFCGGGCPALLPLCGKDECALTRHTCAIAHTIYDHFSAAPEKLLPLAGIY